MSEIRHSSKGQYTYTQRGGYVTVKNYIFIVKDGKKALLLRFSNDSQGIAFDELRFTVVETDPAGKVIKNTHVVFEDLDFAPSTTYAAEKAIIVDDMCVDFKVELECLFSGQYKYVFTSHGVETEFIPHEKVAPDSDGEAEYIHENTVSRKRYGKRRLSGFAAFVALVVIVALAAVGILSRYKVAEREDSAETGPSGYEEGSSAEEDYVRIEGVDGFFEYTTGMGYEMITTENGGIIVNGFEGNFEYGTGVEYEIVTSQGGFSGYYEHVTVAPNP